MAKILVMDDDITTLIMIKSILEKAGHEVITQDNALHLRDELNRHHPEMVITDLFMPDKDGVEVINECQAYRQDLPVVAISGGGEMHQSQLLDIVEELGASRKLFKPFTQAQLLETVEQILPH